MRHRKTRHKLSRDAAHRRSLLRNLCREVIQHERIKTSQAKAKAVKPEVERLRPRVVCIWGEEIGRASCRERVLTGV